MLADRRNQLGMLGLVFVVFLLYGKVAGHEFVNYDDPYHLLENPVVNRGVTVDSLRDAFLTAPASNWQPLTWISHMLVWEVAGSNPAPHLLVNVALHALNAVLLFLALLGLTRRWGPSLLVAFLFAAHPLRVESVAWATERKDVLSGTFWMLTLWAYARYARDPRGRRMAVVVAAFALGLLAKPMLVTLPLVLLLLDVWPLRRSTRSWPRRVREKIPLLAVAIVVAAITLWAQRSAVRELADVTVPDRLANAVLSSWQYVGKALWPVDLAVFYPFPTTFVPWQVGLAGVSFVAVSAGCWRLLRRWPHLTVGWTWYVLTLLPVVGIVTVGNQALADRYTYLPHIGLALLLAFSAAGLRHWVGSAPLAVAASLAVILCAAGTWSQVDTWRTSRTLFEHALAVTKDNHVAHLNLGVLDQEDADDSTARRHFEAVLRIQPGHPYAHNNLGMLAARQDDLARAAHHFESALKSRPNYPDAWDNLGTVSHRRGEVAAAETQYRRALAIEPEHTSALTHLGALLGERGQLEEAADLLRRALLRDPGAADAWNNLGNVRFAQGNLNAAADAYRRALERESLVETIFNLGLIETRLGDPRAGLKRIRTAADHLDATAGILSSAAWRLATHPDATLRDGAAALAYAQRAVDLTGQKDAQALATMAAALAEVGRVDEAVLWQERALRQAPPAAQPELEPALAAFRQGRPFRASP